MVPDQISKLDLIQARIDVIPSDWQLCKVAEALNIRNNLRKPISQEVRETIKGDYPYYGPTKVQGYISEYEQDGTYALIGEDGDHFLKYATMPQTQYISGKCTVNNHAHILESSEICDAQWFFNYFKHRDITNFLSRQGAGRFKLNKATLEKLPMLVPPLSEQRKIAKILSTWDKAIATTEKLIETSKQQKKALMQQLLTGKKRLVNPETGKAFEGKWEVVKLSHFFDRVTEKNKGQSTNVVTISAQHGLIRQEEFFKKSVASETLDNYFILRKGQFAYNKSYSNGYPMGAIKRLNRYEDAVVTSLYICFELKNEKLASSCFMEQYFESGLLNRGLTKVAAEGGRAHGLLNVKPSDFMALSIMVPKFDEQQKIASVLTAADKEIEVLEAKLAHFKQEKKALMQQLLTGKRRVKIEEMEVV
ncbi:restriction endonuclease subunit S [Vibrio alginolyticus]|uniref:restriction endonuclease subunit S n=1 Tax=Vibrio alginolyticus TaxID=663 RepID=UPI0015F610F8|nr:restriction endonuclease subunit S [Vibrio alginolyticus]